MPKQPVVTPKRTGRARLVSLETLKNEPGVTVSELVSRIKTPSQGSISRYLQGSNGTYKDVHKVFTEINMICFDKFDRIDHVYNVVNNSNVEEDAALSQCLDFAILKNC